MGIDQKHSSFVNLEREESWGQEAHIYIYIYRCSAHELTVYSAGYRSIACTFLLSVFREQIYKGNEYLKKKEEMHYFNEPSRLLKEKKKVEIVVRVLR